MNNPRVISLSATIKIPFFSDETEALHMKLEPECIACLIDKARSQLEKGNLSKSDVLTQTIHIGEQILTWIRDPSEILRKYGETALSPASIGTERNLQILSILGNDPYLEDKQLAHRIAEDVVRKLQLDSASSHELSIIQWLRIIAIANSLEFDLVDLGSSPVQHLADQIAAGISRPLNQEFEENARIVAQKLEASRRIILMTDNAGEDVFDILFCNQLKRRGKDVAIVAKPSPVQNDATIQDLEAISKHLKLDISILSSQQRSVGYFPFHESSHLTELLRDSDFVIAKGMGHFETLSGISRIEFHGAIVFKAKCEPVARNARIRKGDYGIFLLNPD